MTAGRQTHRHTHGQTDTQYAALLPEGGRNKKFISFRSRDKPYAGSIARFNVIINETGGQANTTSTI